MSEDLFYFEDDKSQGSASVLAGDGYIGQAIPSPKPLLFDVSWEVCRYGLIGPYSDSACHELEEIPPSRLSLKLIETMKTKYGIKVYYGRWLVKGYPKVFLLDLGSSYNHLNQWRTEMMGSFAVPEDKETNDAIIFGNQTALFFYEFVQLLEGIPIVAHFHEWLAGLGLIKLCQIGVKIATLFTTHATLLGRWLAAGRMDFYNMIGHINPDEEAGRRLIYHRHWIETGAARGADVFTTVSDITAFEAEHALGRHADIITPNGLTVEKFIALHEFQNLHAKNKDKISEFVRGHFYGNLDFNIDKTLYFFTAGRREYYNKGVDLFIEGLADLNHRLKTEHSDITIVAFIIMPGNTNNYNVESIKGQSIRREIRDTCNSLSKKLNERLYASLIVGDIPDPKSLLSQEDVVMMKCRIQAINQNKLLPPIVTHNMLDGDNDEILQHLRRCNLINNRYDRIKVIYHPEFLHVNSPIFPIDYNDFVRGCHLGIFPSYYEPWGYTPAECTVMGVPSVSSDLTGFANYMARCVSNYADHGIYIVNRRGRLFDDSKSQLAQILHDFTKLSRRARIQLRNRTESLSCYLDWKSLGVYYFKARRMALKNVYKIEIPIPDFFERSTQESPIGDPTSENLIF